jgi:hypothetical protein
MKRTITLAAVASIALVIGGFFDLRQALASYLLGFLFVFGIALGSLGIALLHALTGGRWGDAIALPLRAAIATIPFFAVLVLPIIAGVHVLYPWTTDATLLNRAYLNIPFFVIRAVILFAIWIVMSFLVLRSAPGATPFAGGLLVLLCVTICFASWDWVMSLQPHWWSTVFSMIVITGQGLSAMALMTILAIRVPREEDVLIDLGNLLLAFVIFFAYVAFSQLLIIWSGNIKQEIAWYLPRIRTSWAWAGAAIVVFYFFAPFLLLLFRSLKRSGALAFVCALILLMRLCDLLWTVGPAIHPRGFFLSWMDIAAIVALVSIFAILFRRSHRTELEAAHA